eukprot:544744-Prymnesium_polylepis.1
MALLGGHEQRRHRLDAAERAHREAPRRVGTRPQQRLHHLPVALTDGHEQRRHRPDAARGR